MMNIAIDAGNTTTKVGIFSDQTLAEKYLFHDHGALRVFLASRNFDNVIVSAVSVPAADLLSWCNVAGKKIILTPQITLPVGIAYKTPSTLGVDRIAAVCGAFDQYPGTNCLVIDAGTCITYEFLDNTGNYQGGAISPGIAMRFEAMNKFTARLPLVTPIYDPPLTGNSTETCLQSGVVHGIRAEAGGFIQRYRSLYPDIKILLCGGDASFLAGCDPHIIATPDLVLNGLSRILLQQ